MARLPLKKRRQLGRYRFPVKIFRNDPDTATNGQQVENWTNIHFETRGEFIHVTANEIFKNRRLKNDVTALVTVQSCDAAQAIDPKTMRLQVMGQTYAIGGVFDVDLMQDEVEIHLTKRL